MSSDVGQESSESKEEEGQTGRTSCPQCKHVKCCCRNTEEGESEGGESRALSKREAGKCLACRRGKRSCDGLRPCERCIEAGYEHAESCAEEVGPVSSMLC